MIKRTARYCRDSDSLRRDGPRRERHVVSSSFVTTSAAVPLPRRAIPGFWCVWSRRPPMQHSAVFDSWLAGCPMHFASPNAPFWGRCVSLCWPVKGAIHISPRRDAIWSTRPSGGLRQDRGRSRALLEPGASRLLRTTALRQSGRGGGELQSAQAVAPVA
jgi:hypothetical protein